MASDVNNTHSAIPIAKITTDIKPIPTGDNLRLFNHPNPMITTKFQYQTKNQQQTPKQHEATHQATVYDTQRQQEPQDSL